MGNTKQIATVDIVLDLLRQLPPRDRLKVLVQALPEIEQELAAPPWSAGIPARVVEGPGCRYLGRRDRAGTQGSLG
jgi:hypothetical protein